MPYDIRIVHVEWDENGIPSQHVFLIETIMKDPRKCSVLELTTMFDLYADESSWYEDDDDEEYQIQMREDGEWVTVRSITPMRREHVDEWPDHWIP